MTDRGLVLDAARERLPGGKYLVALSGGADSAVAAWATIETAGPGSCRLIHIDHGWPDSSLMEAAARAVADRLGLPLRVMRVEVAAAASREGQARKARLAALESVAGDDEWIVSGHQRDDAAETVLGNLTRGAGAAGLAGMGAVRDRYVRPLLEVSRDTIRRLAREIELPFVDDPANEDPRHRRVAIRHHVIPAMEKVLGGDVPSALVRAGRHLAADDDELERHAAQIPITASGGAVLIPAPVLTTVPIPVAARAVRRALRLARPPYPGTADEVEAVLAVAAGGPTVSLSADYLATREGPMVAVVPAAVPSPPNPVALPIPGRVDFGTGHAMAAVAADRLPRVRPLGSARAVVDLERVGPRLVVRVAEPGERIDIGSGSKLVRDAMAEADIAVRRRSTWPVVEAHGRIVWVAGVRVAAWAGVTQVTRRVLLLSREGTPG